MWSFFKKKTEPGTVSLRDDFSFLGCDMHSHLLPGVDDGSQSLEQSLEMIKAFQKAGYKKLITTPHVFGDFYNNSREKLVTGFEELKRYVADNGVQIELGIAAEYFLDQFFMEQVLPNGLLSFGDNYVLVEVSTVGWPHIFEEIIFAIQSAGYNPILAHPERYTFQDDPDFYRGIKNKGVLLQMNLLSILGYYGKPVKQTAEIFLAENLYDFCGSDVHHARHIDNVYKLAKDHHATMTKLKNYTQFRNRYL